MTNFTDEEQENIRRALRFVRFRAGGWLPISAALGFTKNTLKNVSEGHGVSANLALRLSRMAGVSLEDLIAGKFPPVGACPHCGHCP